MKALRDAFFVFSILIKSYLFDKGKGVLNVKTLRAPFLLFNVNSLEARVPFGDLDFVKYVMALDPSFKQNIYGKRNLLPEFLQTTGTAENKPK